MGQSFETLKRNKRAFKKFNKQMKRSKNCMKNKKYNRYIYEVQGSLQVLEGSIGLNNPIAGEIYSSIGSVYNQLEQLEKANDHLKKAKHIYETFMNQHKHDPLFNDDIEKTEKDLAILYTNLASLSLKFNDLKFLDELNVRLVKNKYVDSKYRLDALFQLAECRKRTERYEEAYEYAKQALDMLNKLKIVNKNYFIQVYIILGLSALRVGKFERAIAILKSLKEGYILQSPDREHVQSYLIEAEKQFKEKMN